MNNNFKYDQYFLMKLALFQCSLITSNAISANHVLTDNKLKLKAGTRDFTWDLLLVAQQPPYFTSAHLQ